MSVPPSLAYEVVDVFTGTAFAGNPLAVVLDTDGLSSAQLQALAREFNLSETAFPQRSDVADYRLRIFTPATELPFAGHPSVGAAWVMARLGRVGRGRVVQECGAGLLALQIGGGPAGQDPDQDQVELTGGPASTGPELDPAPLLAAVGLGPGDLAGPAPRACGTGIDFAFLQVREGALARCRPGCPQDLLGLSVFTLSGASVAARVFAGGAGVAEDPATGSAALGLGVFLRTTGQLPAGGTYDLVQGVEMGRPSLLRCRAHDDGRLTVTGGVVPVARGEIRRPG